MGKKRSRDHTEDHIQKKIRKLESKLKRKRRRLRVISSSSENELSDSEIMDKHEDIVPCSSNNPLSDNLATQPANAEPELDEETLLLLGEAPNIETALGPNIHKDIATRWQDILKKGLTKEVKDAMLKEYIVPANCEFLVPPVLNAEVKAAMPDSLVKRDTVLLDKQKQTGIALAALSKATVMLIAKESHSKVLKAVSDACRLLCDSHFQDTKTRRGFAISSTNNELKDTLIETTRDQYLFGENISDKLKSAKSIQRSGADLKQNKNPKFNKNNFTLRTNTNFKGHLNSRALHRKLPIKPDAGRQRQVPPTRPITTKQPYTTHTHRPYRAPPSRRH